MNQNTINGFDFEEFITGHKDARFSDARKRILDHINESEKKNEEENTKMTITASPAGDWESFSTANVLLNLDARNAQAKKVIAKYAETSVVANMGLGAAGGLVNILLPGASLVAAALSISNQLKNICNPMSEELGLIYQVQPGDIAGYMNVSASVLVGAGFVTVDVGTDFLQEQAMDLILENGAAALGGMIPIVGMGITAALDAVIGATITWRVGTMLATYYQNGGEWAESREKTYKKAKQMAGRSAETNDRVNLGAIPDEMPGVREKHIRSVFILVDAMREFTNDDEEIRAALRKKKIPEKYIDEVLRRRRF